MRMMMKAQIEVESGNLAIAEGSIEHVLDKVMGLCRPEAAYFLTEGGKRTIYAVFDMTGPEMVPQLAEPLFHALGATVDFHPVMVAAELKKGIAIWAENR
jgi:hypothetical protein